MMAQLTVTMIGSDKSHGAVALSDFAGFCKSLHRH
jgi:hypothetical protein